MRMEVPLKTILLRWIFEIGQFDGCSIVVQKSFIAPATFGMHFSGYDGSLLSCLETAARSGRNPLILFKQSCIEALNCESYATPQTVSKHSIKHARWILAYTWSVGLAPSHVFVACARLLLLSERHSLTG